MTRAEIRLFILKQIAYYKDAIAYDTREIEFLNKQIKRERIESKKMLEFVWSHGVVTAFEMEIYTPNYKTSELKKAERDRAKAYRWRQKHIERLHKYENELKQYEPQPAKEPQPQEKTIGKEIETRLNNNEIAPEQICVYIDKNNNIQWIGKAEFAPVYLDRVNLDHIEKEGHELRYYEARPAEDQPQEAETPATTKVYFNGQLKSGAYIQGAFVEVPEEYTMNQLVKAIKARGYTSFMTQTMKTLVQIE